MANYAQNLPIELIREIVNYIDPSHIYNATTICRLWHEATKDIVYAKLKDLDTNFAIHHRNGQEYAERLIIEARHAKTLAGKWRFVVSRQLSWFQAAHHTVHCVVGSPSQDGARYTASKIFASTDGRVLLRSSEREGRLKNELFATDDLRSVVQISPRNFYRRRLAIFARRPDISYQGFEVIAEDLRPSYLLTLPSTSRLVDVSFISSVEGTVPVPGDATRARLEKSERPLHGSAKDLYTPIFDIAMLAADRQVMISTVILKYSRSMRRALRTFSSRLGQSVVIPYVNMWKRLSEGVRHWDGRYSELTRCDSFVYSWFTKAPGTAVDVCRGRSEPTAILLNATQSVTLVACREGIEILFLSFDGGWPGESLGKAGRRWVGFDNPGPEKIIAMVHCRPGAILITRASTATESSSNPTERSTGLLNFPLATWQLVLKEPLSDPFFSYQYDTVPYTAEFTSLHEPETCISQWLESLTLVAHTQHEFIAWDPWGEVVKMVSIRLGEFSKGRAYNIMQLEKVISDLATPKPVALAGTVYHSERQWTSFDCYELKSSSYIAVAAYRIAPLSVLGVMRTIHNELALDTAANAGIVEDIYLAEYQGKAVTEIIDNGHGVTVEPHYIISIRSMKGIAFLRLDNRKSNKRAGIKKYKGADVDFLVLVIGLHGGNEVIVKYLVKAIRPALCGGKKEVWRVKGETMIRDGDRNPPITWRYNDYRAW